MMAGGVQVGMCLGRCRWIQDIERYIVEMIPKDICKVIHARMYHAGYLAYI